METPVNYDNHHPVADSSTHSINPTPHTSPPTTTTTTVLPLLDQEPARPPLPHPAPPPPLLHLRLLLPGAPECASVCLSVAVRVCACWCRPRVMLLAVICRPSSVAFITISIGWLCTHAPTQGYGANVQCFRNSSMNYLDCVQELYETLNHRWEPGAYARNNCFAFVFDSFRARARLDGVSDSHASLSHASYVQQGPCGTTRRFT